MPCGISPKRALKLKLKIRFSILFSFILNIGFWTVTVITSAINKCQLWDFKCKQLIKCFIHKELKLPPSLSEGCLYPKP